MLTCNLAHFQGGIVKSTPSAPKAREPFQPGRDTGTNKRRINMGFASRPSLKENNDTHAQPCIATTVRATSDLAKSTHAPPLLLRFISGPARWLSYRVSDFNPSYRTEWSSLDPLVDELVNCLLGPGAPPLSSSRRCCRLLGRAT